MKAGNDYEFPSTANNSVLVSAQTLRPIPFQSKTVCHTRDFSIELSRQTLYTHNFREIAHIGIIGIETTLEPYFCK